MKSLGELIRDRRLRNGWTLEQLSERSGVDVGTISALETRQSNRSKYALQIAAGFGITLDELLAAAPEGSYPERDVAVSNVVSDFKVEYSVRETGKVPLISYVQAGALNSVEDRFYPGEADEWVLTWHAKPGPKSFALRVEGDSMTSSGNGHSFPDGTIITVDPDRCPKPGDFVVAKDVQTQSATFKRLTSDGARWFLKPLNPAYPVIEIDDPNLRVIGVVIEWSVGGKL